MSVIVSPIADDRRTSWSVTTTPTILSETASTSPLKLAGARRWTLLVTTASQGLSALRLRYRTRASGQWSEWESISTGLPLSAGSTLRISESDGSAYELDVEATAASGTATVALDVVGY